MNAASAACAASGSEVDWHGIDWAKGHQRVRRLQARIVKATQEGIEDSETGPTRGL